MKKNAARSSGRGRDLGAAKRLRGDSDDYDDVLLPFNGPFPAVGTIFSKELKYYDTFLADVTIEEVLNNAAVISIYANADTPFGPETGSGPSHRNGSYCKVVSWQIRGQVEMAPAAHVTRAPMGRRVMIALVLDKYPDYGDSSQSFSANDVFISPNGQGAVYPLRNPYRADRFDVLRVEFIDIPAGAFVIADPLLPDEIVAAGTSVGFDFFVPLNVVVKFNPAVNDRTYLSCINNNFGVVCTVSQHPGFGIESYQQPTLEYNSRFRYYTGP